MACIASYVSKFSISIRTNLFTYLKFGNHSLYSINSGQTGREERKYVYQVELFQLAISLNQITGITAKSIPLDGMPHTSNRTNILGVFMKLNPLLSRELGNCSGSSYHIPRPLGDQDPWWDHPYFISDDRSSVEYIRLSGRHVCFEKKKKKTRNTSLSCDTILYLENQRKILILKFKIT